MLHGMLHGVHNLARPTSLPSSRFEVELQSLRMRLAAEHQMQLDRADAGSYTSLQVWCG